jgi:hypothetical protein
MRVVVSYRALLNAAPSPFLALSIELLQVGPEIFYSAAFLMPPNTRISDADHASETAHILVLGPARGSTFALVHRLLILHSLVRQLGLGAAETDAGELNVRLIAFPPVSSDVPVRKGCQPRMHIGRSVFHPLGDARSRNR